MLDLHAWVVIPSVQICTLGGLVSKSMKPKCAFFQIMHDWVLRPTRPCKNARQTLTSVTYLMRSTRLCILDKYARSGFTTNPTVHRSSCTLGLTTQGCVYNCRGSYFSDSPRNHSSSPSLRRSPRSSFTPAAPPPPLPLLPPPPSSTASTPALLSLLPPSAPTALGWRRTSSSTMVRTTSGSTRS